MGDGVGDGDVDGYDGGYGGGDGDGDGVDDGDGDGDDYGSGDGDGGDGDGDGDGDGGGNSGRGRDGCCVCFGVDYRKYHGANKSKKTDTSITFELQYLKRREVRESNCERRAAGVADLGGCSV
jgi:hypothetical protein